MIRNRFSIALAVIVCGALALSLADPASAFVRLGRAGATTPVVQAHWFDSELPLKSVIDPTNNDIPAATALAIIQASAQSWQDVNTSYFTVNAYQFTGAPGDSQPVLALDGQNSVLFVTDLTGATFPPGVIAFVRSFVDNTDGHTVDADMAFNDRDFFGNTTAPAANPPTPPGGFPQTSVDLQAVITHEYGHYFSLDHTSVLGATMIPFIQNNTTQRSLDLDDRAGLSTVYPESASRPGGVTPGGVDFGATTGTISGTVLSGFNGSAVFGAHVEAFLFTGGPLNPANSISAISGELTLRAGQGDFQIHGLPPGNYAVRIVPLDGVNTTASDANIGGVYNGLDINFEPEFYNGAGESGDGFADPPGNAVLVSVAAASDAGGVNFITNAYAGRVVMAQYGQFENIVFRRNTGYLAVRYDMPFDVPYTVAKVQFPTFTFNGVPATFLSVKLCRIDTATGLPDLANPLYSAAPYNGSPNGLNEIPLNLTMTNPGEVLFWVWEFPQEITPPFPNNFPFLRSDLVTMERGNFLNSYSISLAGAGGVLVDVNLIASLFINMGNASDAPIVGPANLGANRTATNMEFPYAAPGDFRADGFPLPPNSLDEVQLLVRSAGAPGTYSVAATGGKGSGAIKVSPAPTNATPQIWATRALDKNGNLSITSNANITGFNEDADEANGKVHQATALTPPVVNRLERFSPAGDQDFYKIFAKPGDVIDASAAGVRTTIPPAPNDLDGRNDPDPIMILYDNTGTIVDFNDDFTGLNPRIIFTVPPPSGNSNSTAPREFRIQVANFYGSLLDPAGAPRFPAPSLYRLDVSVTSPANAAALASRSVNLDRFSFGNYGPNPANPTVKLGYVIPRSSGAQNVQLRVFDVNGRLVRTLVNKSQDPGPYAALWDGRDDNGHGVASGRYFARIQVGSVFTEKTQTTLLM
jgi:hypothetical protein